MPRTPLIERHYLHVGTATSAENGRERARTIAPALREAEHTSCSVLQLKLIDLVLHVGNTVAGDRIQDLLGVLCRFLSDSRGVQGRLISVLRDVAVDLRGVDCAVVIGRVDRAESIAAILLSYRLFILCFL